MEKLNFWQKIIGAFDNFTEKAFSARKLTAFTIIVCVVVGHGFYFKHSYIKDDFSQWPEILVIDFFAAAFFLGIITIQEIIEFKYGKQNEKQINPIDNGNNL